MADFRQALYYPYIHMKDEAWLKTAALFYDKLCRIKPDNFVVEDSETAKQLDGECGFIENVSSGQAAQKIKGRFLEYAVTNLKENEHRLALNRELADAAADDSEIHFAKVPEVVAEKLKELGLVKTQKRDNFYNFEPATAAVYMTFLANEIAEDKGIAVVTDDPAYYPFLVGAKGAEFGGDPYFDQQFALANLVVRKRLPDPKSVRKTPIERIIEFRKRYDAQRKNFMDTLAGLVKELQKEKLSQEAMKHVLQEKEAAVEKEYDAYKTALTTAQIKLGGTLLGLSFPAWLNNFTSTLAHDTHAPIALCIMGLGAMYVAAKTAETTYSYYKTRKTSPWSYLHSIEKKFGKRERLQQLGVAGDLNNKFVYFGY